MYVYIITYYLKKLDGIKIYIYIQKLKKNRGEERKLHKDGYKTLVDKNFTFF